MTVLLLASASPRRRELLSAILPQFEVSPSDVLEDVPARTGAADAVALLAERKAGAIAPATPDAVVLAADTLVSRGDRLFGKPVGAEMARTFLRTLRGRTHSVHTGVCLRSRRGSSMRVVRTDVTLRRFSDGEIEASIEAGIPFDKAGAYAIQDPLLNPVERIDGCYCNVMGLPLWDVWEMVAASGAGECLARPDETRAICGDCPRRPATPGAPRPAGVP